MASVTAEPATIKLAPGAPSQLTATPKDADGNTLAGRAVTWGSSNRGVASVSATGLLTAVSDGGPVAITDHGSG